MLTLSYDTFRQLAKKTPGPVKSNAVFGILYPYQINRLEVKFNNNKYFLSVNNKIIPENKSLILRTLQNSVPINFLANDLEILNGKKIACYFQRTPENYGMVLMFLSSFIIGGFMFLTKKSKDNQSLPIHPFYY